MVLTIDDEILSDIIILGQWAFLLQLHSIMYDNNVIHMSEFVQVHCKLVQNPGLHVSDEFAKNFTYRPGIFMVGYLK